MHEHHEALRYGSARWCRDDELRRAGLLSGRGLRKGFWCGSPLDIDTDAPSLTVAGAGAGKTLTLLAMAIAHNADQRNFIVDPRGELAAITLPAFARHRAFVHCWNPCRIAGLPFSHVNPLDILKRGPRLSADCKFIVENLIPLSGSANGKFFELRAREWVSCLLRYHVERYGWVSFPALYRLINTIEGDPTEWESHVEWMLGSSEKTIQRVASEIFRKQQSDARDLGGILGEIYAYFNFLDDPMLQEALEHSDFSLEALCDHQQPATLFLNVPIEYISLWAPVLRVMFTTAMLYKGRAPHAPRLTMIVDEAGQLGNFDALLKAFTFGRGSGVRAWALFQDTSQITRAYGNSALQSFMGSAAVRQFFGVRDFETAHMVSQMLGTQTLEYDDTLRQAEARKAEFNARLGLSRGANPVDVAYDLHHFRAAAQNRSMMARLLMTPDEILAMPDDRQILFVSGKNLRPIYAERYSYLTHGEPGLYLPNPYHASDGTMPIPSVRGDRRARVITEPVPPELAHLPQYKGCDGTWSYIEGYRP